MRMRSIFSKKWVHAVIWAGLAAYLALYDPVRARFFTKVGKPVSVGYTDYVDTETEYEIDQFAEVRYEGEYVYQLRGWAFPQGSLVRAEEYAKQVVLEDQRGKGFVFAARTSERTDLALAYSVQAAEMEGAGFLATISAPVLPRGAYRVGILYTAPDSSAVFRWTDRYIVRSPNALRMYKYYSGLDDSLDDLIQRWRIMTGLQPITGMFCDFDALRTSLSDAPNVFFLHGWGFPVDQDVPLDQYRRQVVLFDKFAIPHLLDATPRSRPDVQEAYAGLGRDVALSGFTARIPASILPPGVYRLGLLYTDGASSSAFTPTNMCIQWASDSLSLIRCATAGED